MSDAVWEQQKKDAASWFGLPPHKLGVGQRTGSLEEENASYVQGSLSHHLCTIDAECELKLLRPEEENLYVASDFKHLMRADTKTTAEVGVMTVNAGLITVDEWRADQDRDELPDGAGAKPRRPANIVVVREEPTDPEPGLGSEQTKTPMDDGSTEGARSSVRAAAYVDCKRRITSTIGYLKTHARKKGAAKFIRWADEGLPEAVEKLLAGATPVLSAFAVVHDAPVERTLGLARENLTTGFSEAILRAAEEEGEEVFLAAITDQLEALRAALEADFLERILTDED